MDNALPDSREQFLDQSDTKPAIQRGSEERIAQLLRNLLGEMTEAKVIDKDTEKELYVKIGSALKSFYKKDEQPQQQSPQQNNQPQQASESYHELRSRRLKKALLHNFN